MRQPSLWRSEAPFIAHSRPITSGFQHAYLVFEVGNLAPVVGVLRGIANWGEWPMKRLASMTLVTVALVACRGLFVGPLGEVGEIATVTGTVLSVDISPMAYDGPAEIVLRSERHGSVTAYVQSCLGGCALDAVNQLAEVEAGETWQVTGELQKDGSLVLYSDVDHGLLGLSEK